MEKITCRKEKALFDFITSNLRQQKGLEAIPALFAL
jgi:hypothetical protein